MFKYIGIYFSIEVCPYSFLKSSLCHLHNYSIEPFKYSRRLFFFLSSTVHNYVSYELTSSEEIELYRSIN